MKRIAIGCFLLTAVLFSCKPKSKFDLTDKMLENVPDSVLIVDSMINILADIHLAEAWATENKSDSLNSDQRLKLYYAAIFAEHHVKAERYRSSYAYYSNEPVLMNYIYTRVTEKLNLLESKNIQYKQK